MNDYSKIRIKAARIASLTLPPCEVEFRGFDLLDIQGYVELADHAVDPLKRVHEPASGIAFCLGELAEPSTVLQLHVDAS
jgi:hypothetical protein